LLDAPFGRTREENNSKHDDGDNSDSESSGESGSWDGLDDDSESNPRMLLDNGGSSEEEGGESPDRGLALSLLSRRARSGVEAAGSTQETLGSMG